MKEIQRPFIVVGLGYGDEGKGGITDALVRRYGCSLVIRFNGGAQAAHNIWTDDGRHHTFSQFGSGTFVPGVKTLLSRFMLVNPAALLNEEQFLCHVGVKDAFDRLYIDERALVTTPWHIQLNRLKENARGAARHGSCGMGIGETVAYSLEHPHDALRVGDLIGPHLRSKLANILSILCWKYPEFSHILGRHTIKETLEKMLAFAAEAYIVDKDKACRLIANFPCVFEGAQGVLLDEDFGVAPHTTWSKTTDANALALLAEAEVRAKPVRIGVTRWFMTRHGTGPFATENKALQHLIADDDNGTGEFQGAFRVGSMDFDLLRHAINVNNSLDCLAVTHLDKNADAEGWLKVLHAESGIPIGITSYGKTASHKSFIADKKPRRTSSGALQLT